MAISATALVVWTRPLAIQCFSAALIFDNDQVWNGPLDLEGHLMTVCFRWLRSALIVVATLSFSPAHAADPQQVLTQWYRLVLELVRHTPTYSPPVASRSFAYIGIAVWEVTASGTRGLQSLSGQLNAMPAPPARPEGSYDEAVVLQAALSAAVQDFFGNTGPTGQRAIAAMARTQHKIVVAGLAPDVVARSEAYGKAVAAHVVAWSAGDGGALVENMGFPYEYTLQDGPAHWVSTSAIRQQQVPLLPGWGKNRPLAMPSGASCPLPAPPDYSEDPASAFYAEAKEVLDVAAALTDEQKLIARFWSDDPMLSPTPPGHWISIALQILARDKAGIAASAEILARLGIAVSDSFIACWDSKYQYDLLRPVTYIRRLMDPAFQPLLITPPFPEYPSGHSTQSGAAAAVLTEFFGQDFAFTDATHVDDGLPARDYPSFDAAASEAALSRLYGGIHFRAAIDRGLDQGRCIGAYVAALKMKDD
ncbi:MAG: vanadium-dependent haloperoxidase [Hoeflea sp.]|uniref:vanadium-dependent haloperoxidase n=1 Tax=Hoeflea sp. TaxID=1940281 RepID=UPI00273157C2|nr:vanadium-dependent haloperoxidase [Hoeflea sp.]MDP2119289.1 vanadium-dependent haloperoxidase [Hoeflea sp.]